jgi:predicted amidohydrolase
MSKFKVALAQMSPTIGAIEANVQIHVRFAQIAAENSCDLLLFPELSITGYTRARAAELTISPEDERLDRLREIARQFGMTIIAGAPVASGSAKPYLGSIVMRPADSVVYHKQHLHGGEKLCYSPGDAACVADINGVSVGLAICADIGVASHPAEAAQRGASVYAAGVFVSEGGYEVDAALMCGYAAKYKMAVIMSNFGNANGAWDTAGKSAVWDESGRVVAIADGAEDVLVVAARNDDGWSGKLLSV